MAKQRRSATKMENCTRVSSSPCLRPPPTGPQHIPLTIIVARSQAESDQLPFSIPCASSMHDGHDVSYRQPVPWSAGTSNPHTGGEKHATPRASSRAVRRPGGVGPWAPFTPCECPVSSRLWARGRLGRDPLHLGRDGDARREDRWR